MSSPEQGEYVHHKPNFPIFFIRSHLTNKKSHFFPKKKGKTLRPCFMIARMSDPSTRSSQSDRRPGAPPPLHPVADFPGAVQHPTAEPSFSRHFPGPFPNPFRHNDLFPPPIRSPRNHGSTHSEAPTAMAQVRHPPLGHDSRDGLGRCMGARFVRP